MINKNSRIDNVKPYKPSKATAPDEELPTQKSPLADLFKAPTDPDELEAERDWLYGRTSTKPTLKTTKSSTFKK